MSTSELLTVVYATGLIVWLITAWLFTRLHAMAATLELDGLAEIVVIGVFWPIAIPVMIYFALTGRGGFR